MPRASDLPSLIGRHATRLTGTKTSSCVFVEDWRQDSSRLTALLFAAGESEPRLVAKVGRRGGGERVTAEHRNLEILSRSRESEFARSVPRSLGCVGMSEAVVLLESVVPGRPLRPPRRRAALERLTDRICDWLLAFHRVARAGSAAESSLHEGILLQPFAAYRQSFCIDQAEERFLVRMERLAEQVARDAISAVFAHGDLCPVNILVEDGDFGVIDWDRPFVPSPPGFDLIHLLTCLAPGDAGDRLRPFKTAFFEQNPLSAAARRCLGRYLRALGIPVEALRLLFTLCWIGYALEKLAALKQSGADSLWLRRGNAWALTPLVDGACLNLRWLSRHENRLVLP